MAVLEVTQVRFDVVQSEVVESAAMLSVEMGFAHVGADIVQAVAVEFANGSRYLYHGNLEVIGNFIQRVMSHVNNPSTVRLGAYFNTEVRPVLTAIRLG